MVDPAQYAQYASMIVCLCTSMCVQSREVQWPSLALMIKQYFAAPASSAQVERVFSAAGKMHSDLRKSAKDSSPQHSINTD